MSFQVIESKEIPLAERVTTDRAGQSFLMLHWCLKCMRFASRNESMKDAQRDSLMLVIQIGIMHV